MALVPTLRQQMRGWVVRPETRVPEKDMCSDPILVRGAMKTDHPVDYRNGFVYAETADEAELYDLAHGYTQ